ncbi:hypothetical protein [Asticcacaulis benevestitus]|uniref:Uncharacterized protein n=1 Tax=Asticcacaulis benevestitus DSM 16100 = ATCC BAA-896 TaxID=1121022 RepID=V4R8R5_9CAUL|nr:hypothetical protein [Asticcacaulis benevestitus]ESQ87828.1 hypothetical protein ABENE_16885 [Asticcacaulis benevestitus DSM 16100 = ATCC BAA-896]
MHKNWKILPALLAASLGACANAEVSQGFTSQPQITYAPYPGGEPGRAIPLRPEKSLYTFPADPEAATFATQPDVRTKAAKACGLDRIIYEETGPELIFGTGQTADLVHARALMMWCRAYEPQPQPGSVMRVHFRTSGDLILSVSSQLEKADGKPLGAVSQTPGGYRMISVIYEAARDAVIPMSQKHIGGDDVFDIWCRKAPVNFNYWPSIELREYGQGDNYKLLGDISKRSGGLSSPEECTADANCNIRFTKDFEKSSLPAVWIGSHYSRNDFPRPGVEKGSALLVNSHARWVFDGDLPRLKHFVEYKSVTFGRPCKVRPVPKVIGLSNAEADAFLKGHTGSAFDAAWNEPDADCRLSRFEMGDHGMDGQGGYSIELMPSKYGGVRMRTSQIFLRDGRTYMAAHFYVDRNATAGFTKSCETTIIN